MPEQSKKKTTAKKTTAAAKPAPSPAPVKPVAPVIPPKAAPVAVAPKAAPQPAKTVTESERQRMVQEAAYYMAEKRGFTGNPHDDWVAAELQVNTELARKGIRVAG